MSFLMNSDEINEDLLNSINMGMGLNSEEFQNLFPNQIVSEIKSETIEVRMSMPGKKREREEPDEINPFFDQNGNPILHNMNQQNLPFSAFQKEENGNLGSIHFNESPLIPFLGKNPQAISSQQMLNDIQKQQIEQKEKIEQIYAFQISLMQNPQAEPFKSLANDQFALKSVIENELKILCQIFDNTILDPPDLQRYYHLKQDLEIQLRQLELLISEIQQLAQTSRNPQYLVSLVVIKQPFPLVITKGKQLTEEQLQVQLLKSSCLPIKSISPIQCAIVSDMNTKSTTGKMLEYDIQNIDPSTLIAKFPIKFNQGTKKAPANLKFALSIQLAGNPNPINIESLNSSPLVVITNEIQWDGSAGTLLKKEVFPQGQFEIPWPRLANTLQQHVLRATKQDLFKPRRYLTNYDLNYLHHKFLDAKDIIAQKDFDIFWEWFGKAMQKIRYQRHICSMWQNGLLYGFISKTDVEKSLENQEPGTFIIRFSESQSGQFAVAYVSLDLPRRIKHYLVQKNDTAASKKTLPDFLNEQPQFIKLLVLSTGMDGKPAFIAKTKVVALEQFLQNSKGTQMEKTEGGYEGLD